MRGYIEKDVRQRCQSVQTNVSLHERSEAKEDNDSAVMHEKDISNRTCLDDSRPRVQPNKRKRVIIAIYG